MTRSSSGGRKLDSVAEKLPPTSVCCHNFNFNLGSSILRFFYFCLDGAQEIEGGGWTDPTLIHQFFNFLIYVWTGSEWQGESEFHSRFSVLSIFKWDYLPKLCRLQPARYAISPTLDKHNKNLKIIWASISI
jgi:hypothetical protein